MTPLVHRFVIAGAALALSTISAASAQTVRPKGDQRGLAAVKPVAASVTACATGLMEIAPVSFDAGGRPDAWVIVHRVNGEIVSAERVTLREIEQVRRAPCGADPWRGETLAG